MDDSPPAVAPVFEVNLEAMRRYRLGRLLREIEARDVAGALFFDPVNIRYATDCTNMQVWTLHNPARYALVLAGGPVILWEFHGALHLSDDLPLVTETRVGTPWFSFRGRCRRHAEGTRVRRRDRVGDPGSRQRQRASRR